MKMTSNVHTHSTWCDGLGTPREMADAAVALGFTDLGFSSHSPAPFDPTCSGIKNEAGYRSEIAALREEYKGKLNILCGVEQDYYAPVNRNNYDYLIGSVHYLPVVDRDYYAADDTAAIFSKALDVRYRGNSKKMVQDFYALTIENAQRYQPDIVGHFDMITKFNRGNAFFDEDGNWYQSIALEAMDAVIDAVQPYGGMVELNTSVMFKNVRDVPYPAPFLLERLAERNMRMIITTDSHRTSSLAGGFDRALSFLKSAGFSSMAVLRDGAFVDVHLD